MIYINDVIFHYRILHGLVLQLYLQLGMKMGKVYRVVTFDHGDFMSSWVQFCTKKRIASTNTFSRKFWKLVILIVHILITYC